MKDYKKLYEEALELMRDCEPDENGYVHVCPEDIFPELKEESEDEKIKKAIIYVLNHTDYNVIEEVNFGVSQMEFWLEKQAQHTKFRESIQIGDKVTRNQDGELVNLSQLERVAKPAEKEGPKYKDGDWISNGEYTWFVKCVGTGFYHLISPEGRIVDDTICHVDANFHPWSLQDAKAGDVLHSQHLVEGFEWLGVFKGRNEAKDKLYFYCFWESTDDKFNEVRNDMSFVNYDDFAPAAKDWRDLLFRKMKEAGYEFDFDKLELKKIEPTPAEKDEPKFKVGDTIRPKGSNAEYTITSISDGFYHGKGWYIGIGCENDYELVGQEPADKIKPKFKIGDIITVKPMKCHDRIFVGKPQKIVDITETSYLLDDGKPYGIRLQDGWELADLKSVWTEQDERIMHNTLAYIINSREKSDCTIEAKIWLNSLKYRVQPQPKGEWSAEDENNLNSCIAKLEIDMQHWEGHGKTMVDRDKELADWLKSLKDRVQPKQEWSEEDETMRNICIRHIEDELERVRNDKYGHSEIISDLKESCRERIKWLKSLRPRIQWKPSKGQLECLGYAIDKAEKDYSPLTNNRIYLTLIELRRQLEKLTE